VAAKCPQNVKSISSTWDQHHHHECPNSVWKMPDCHDGMIDNLIYMPSTRQNPRAGQFTRL